MFEQYVDKDLIEFFPDGKLFRILFDNISCKFRILGRDQYDMDKLINTFSDVNPGAFFSKQYGYHADSKVYAVNKFGYFPIGLIFEVLKYIKTQYGTVSVIAMSQNVKSFLEDYLMPLKTFASRHDRNLFEISNISKKYELRNYQTEIIKSIIFDGYGRGLFEAPTGSGKSFTIANLIYTLQQQYDSSLRYLIFVPNRQLVDQFHSDLLDYGFSEDCITRLTGGVKKYNKDAQIIIGNRQYLFKNKEKLPKIDVLIADEAHSVSVQGNSTYDFVESINCKFKIGCSGTLPRNKYNKWSLMGLFSRIIYTEDIVKLQEQGYLTKLHIKLLSITDEDVEKNKDLLFNLHSRHHYVEGGDIAFNASYTDELNYIAKHYEKLYTPIFNEISKMDGNVLILFDRIEVGKNMFDYANEVKLRNANIVYIDGSVKVDYREQVRKEFEKSSNNIMFGEVAVMSTGINIKNLPNIVFMFSGKSTTRVIQSIGRTLRLHTDKNIAKLLDITFNFKYSRKHLRERLRLYSEFYHKSRPDEIEKVQI